MTLRGALGMFEPKNLFLWTQTYETKNPNPKTQESKLKILPLEPKSSNLKTYAQRI